MKLLIVGCGRVGSSIARNMSDDGHDVSVIDEDPEALQRLPESWPGRFVHGHGLDTEVLVEGGIGTADACVVCTDGDNTNIVIAQIARKRFDCPCVVTRVLDPARAAFYDTLGLQTVCPTSRSIDIMTEAICATPGRMPGEG
ncbi:MAG TPA: TrkA family potassium uptake protein [Gaiellales bacterium]|jgi:trk system potassium uptake protein TrkA|nr:TrkA family potassium uptake protein [Gaiellales bacterium]